MCAIAAGGAPWQEARRAAYEAGWAARLDAVSVPLAASADGATLADDLCAQTALPAFPTASVDGFAVRGAGPWRLAGQVLAGQIAADLGSDGTAVAVATGAMMPADAEAIIRIEESAEADGLITGSPRDKREWRSAGEEASRGDVLVRAGAPVTPATLGLAAACGYDTLSVRPRPRVALVVSGDELLTSGLSGDGKIRDALGPQVPGWLARLGADVTPSAPVLAGDDLDSHLAAIGEVLDAGADIVAFTGGTMHGPADYLRAALSKLNATYVVDTVQGRPGRPMLLASVPSQDGRAALLAGLPGNPVPAVLALLMLVGPAICGLTGRPLAGLPVIELAAPIRDRRENAHFALVSRDPGGRARPVNRASSSALTDLLLAVGFAVIEPHRPGSEGDRVPFIAMPLVSGETLPGSAGGSGGPGGPE